MHVLSQLAFGILVVLIVATLVGRHIKRRHSPHAPHAVIDNMNTRIHAWWIIVVLVGLASWFGAVGLGLLFAAASLQGVREYRPATGSRSFPTWALVVAATGMQYAFAVTGNSLAFMQIGRAHV